MFIQRRDERNERKKCFLEETLGYVLGGLVLN